jgi:hypothetical protein
MGLNDTHFTSPDRSPGESLEEYQRDVTFRQQLASVFKPVSAHNVQMETGHYLLPVTHPEAFGPGGVTGPQVIIHHRNDPDDSLALPLGRDPSRWMGDLARHLNSRPVMERLRDQMNGPYGDE